MLCRHPTHFVPLCMCCVEGLECERGVVSVRVLCGCDEERKKGRRDGKDDLMRRREEEGRRRKRKGDVLRHVPR